jgi:hypothetical protein
VTFETFFKLFNVDVLHFNIKAIRGTLINRLSTTGNRVSYRDDMLDVYSMSIDESIEKLFSKQSIVKIVFESRS